jgi:hypothetical protein
MTVVLSLFRQLLLGNGSACHKTLKCSMIGE